MSAFDVLRIMTHTNTLYRELRKQEAEYTGDFMGKTLVRDYLNTIDDNWAYLGV